MTICLVRCPSSFLIDERAFPPLGLMAVGAVGTFLAWSTDGQIKPPRTLREAVVAPLAQLLKRPAIAEILGFCLLYKIGDQLVLMETVYPGKAMKKNAPLLFSGRQIVAVVTHILYGPVYGLAQDWCIMSIRVIWKREGER